MIMLPRTIWITEYIHPPEADRLAAEFGRARECMGQFATEADRVNISLRQGWEGHQAAHFLDTSQSMPPDMRTCSDWFGAQEQKFRTITVAVRRRLVIRG